MLFSNDGARNDTYNCSLDGYYIANNFPVSVRAVTVAHGLCINDCHRNRLIEIIVNEEMLDA
jgi:hypothetical protein